MQNAIRFSVRKLLIWLTVFALLIGAMATLTVPPILILASSLVLALSFLLDAYLIATRNEPACLRFAKYIVHYASSTSIAAIVCFGFVQLDSEIVARSPPQPAFPLLYLVSGQFAQDIGDYIGRAITFCVGFMVIFTSAGTIGLLLSLLILRRWRAAKWYALLNAPATCLLLWAIADMISEYLST